jgi:hypothetical protein
MDRVNDMFNWVVDILLNLIGGKNSQPVPISITAGDNRVSPKYVPPRK